MGPGVDVEFAVERRASAPGSAPASNPGEFAPADGRVWILQARPITGVGFPKGGDADTVWSRTNFGEALPGPATPLTWSVASAFGEQGLSPRRSARFRLSRPRGATTRRERARPLR